MNLLENNRCKISFEFEEGEKPGHFVVGLSGTAGRADSAGLAVFVVQKAERAPPTRFRFALIEPDLNLFQQIRNFASQYAIVTTLKIISKFGINRNKKTQISIVIQTQNRNSSFLALFLTRVAR